MMPGRLDGKVAVITGSGSGVGAATARRFAAEGARLVLNEVRPERLDRLIAELRAAGAEVVGEAGDAFDRPTVDALVGLAVAEYGRVDVLYAHPHHEVPQLVGEITDAEWRAHQVGTLDSVFFAVRAVLPHMIEQRSGSIIAASSGASIGGEHMFGAYAANKAAVNSLMETVAMEYGSYNIRANAVTPGPLAGPPPGPEAVEMMRKAFGGVPADPMARASPFNLKRFSMPEEVASLILFLASDESSTITGICVRSNIRAKRRPGD